MLLLLVIILELVQSLKLWHSIKTKHKILFRQASIKIGLMFQMILGAKTISKTNFQFKIEIFSFYSILHDMWIINL